LTRGSREKLISLLDYVEQVVRLDERVAFRLSDFRLPDGTGFAVSEEDTRNLPGIHHDMRDDEGPVWLEVARLARKEPPSPAPEIGEWVLLSGDPSRPPQARAERIVTVSAHERDQSIAKGEVRTDDILVAPKRKSDPLDAPEQYDLTLRLDDRPAIAAAIETWIAGVWTPWAAEELPRRRTIALYQLLYKIYQLMEVGGSDRTIELIWGVGRVNWEKDGRSIDRPLIERRVEVELDDALGGLIRIRPTSAEAMFDLKPYEEMGCAGLPNLSDLIRREIRLAAETDGVSPFARESFDPILSAAAARLDPDGRYTPDVSPVNERRRQGASPSLTVSDEWVLFARPRSQHVVLQDIERLRNVAQDEHRPIGGLAERLVTDPSRTPGGGTWEPMGSGNPGSTDGPSTPGSDTAPFDVYFPKPFNDDQIEIVHRLRRNPKTFESVGTAHRLQNSRVAPKSWSACFWDSP